MSGARRSWRRSRRYRDSVATVSGPVWLTIDYRWNFSHLAVYAQRWDWTTVFLDGERVGSECKRNNGLNILAWNGRRSEFPMALALSAGEHSVRVRSSYRSVIGDEPDLLSFVFVAEEREVIDVVICAQEGRGPNSRFPAARLSFR